MLITLLFLLFGALQLRYSRRPAWPWALLLFALMTAAGVYLMGQGISPFANVALSLLAWVYFILLRRTSGLRRRVVYIAGAVFPFVIIYTLLWRGAV